MCVQTSTKHVPAARVAMTTMVTDLSPKNQEKKWRMCGYQSVYSRHWNELGALRVVIPGEVVTSLDSEVTSGVID